MKLKPGVKIRGIRQEAVLAMGIVDAVFRGYGAEVTITSVMDGEHMEGSLHERGLAFDFRTRGFTENMIQEFAQECKNRLGEEFDVVIEQDHIHVEFDPPSF